MQKLNEAPILDQTEGHTNKLLMMALWKLNGNEAVKLTAADIDACMAANGGLPTLFMHGHSDSVELSIIGPERAAAIAAHQRSITPQRVQ